MGFLIALAVMLLILFLKIGVRVRSQGETSLTLGIGIFKLPLFPGKEKEIKLSDYKIAKFRKDQAKLAAAEAEKKQKKRSKKKNSTEDKTAEKVEAARLDKEGQSKPKRDIMGLVETVTELVKVFLSRFGRHLYIKVRRLVIIVGSEDAATTAILYGAVCGAVQCLLELFHNCLNIRFVRSTDIRVEPDFTALKPQAEVDITFSVRVWQIFDMLIRTGLAYLKKLL